MGLFGFGKKKKAKQEEEIEQESVATAQEEAQEIADEDAVVVSDARGPWDANDENTPDYDDYLSLGAYYLPFMQGIELRVKAHRTSGQILGCTITYGGSSLEVEAFAAPKTLGLWDDLREDLLAKNEQASEQDGEFGTEVLLPVKMKNGKSAMTRIVGVDGPRWMLRGIFSGNAASKPEHKETKALNDFFANIVVERGEEPLAPRDLLPMHPPLTPSERRAQAAQDDEQDATNTEIPGKPEGPMDTDQQVEVKTTLSRGPMFSEVR